jgi:L-iditol 2-dehydrogenase
MKAALMLGPHKMEIGERDIPSYGDDEVLVNIKHVGICGADLEFFKDGAIGGWVLSYPHILGHEPAGIVAETGRNVKHLKPGDKVVIEPGKPCFNCPTCQKGLYNLCNEMRFMSVPGDAGAPGAFCEYVAWPSRLVYKVPDSVDTADACLAEPLAVGIHSVEQSGIRFGQSAAVIGGGCIGLCTTLVLKAQGISEIYVTDRHSGRIAKAKAIGVTAVYNDKEVDTVKAIKDASGGVDAVYECTGSQKAIDQAVPLLKKGGMLTLIGLFGAPKQQVDLNGLIFVEGSITTNFRYRNNHPAAISAIASGTIPIRNVVSHSFPLEKLGEALELNLSNKDEVTKIVIKV